MVQERLPRKLPKITIDYEKCTVPFLCKKCLQICPDAVFWVRCVSEERLKETDPRIPGTYKLNPLRRNKCTMCNKCIEVCPVDAIKIEAPQEVMLGLLVGKQRVRLKRGVIIDMTASTAKDGYCEFSMKKL